MTVKVALKGGSYRMMGKLVANAMKNVQVVKPILISVHNVPMGTI